MQIPEDIEELPIAHSNRGLPKADIHFDLLQ
jgi:hypothetical protein